MRPTKELELIEQLLQARRPKKSTSGEQLAWERGYLAAILARAASGDSSVLALLKRELGRS